MDKKIIFGLGAIATVGAIVGGIYFSQNNPFNLESSPDGTVADEQKIDKLYFEGLEDKDRYTFCLGKEEIKGVYTNTVLGNEKGDVDYVSEDLSVFDQESNKLYILGRKINYKYSGEANLVLGVGEGKMQITENGVITEYYKKNIAPIRIDYNSKILSPAPERKNTDWVAITIKSIGTLAGLTQEETRQETGDAKVFCSFFSLAGGPLKNGALMTQDFFFFEKACPDHSPNPGVKFSGNFKFECNTIENKRGVEIAKEYQEAEELRKEFEATNDASEDGDLETEFQKIIPESSSDDSEMQKKLQQLRDEMKADQRNQ